MSRFLLDVDVVFPLLVEGHKNHRAAVAWLDTIDEPQVAGVCRAVQLGVVRLLSQRTPMGDSRLSPARALECFDALMLDSRLHYVAEPTSIDPCWRQLVTLLEPTSILGTDVHLAAFAISSGRAIVTFDAGYRRFPNLNLILLQS